MVLATVRCRPDSAAGSYLAYVRVQAAVGPGFQEACLGRPQRPAPPDAACCSGRRRFARQCPSELCLGEFHVAPGRRGPHPFASHPPTPILARGLGKGSELQVHTAFVVAS